MNAMNRREFLGGSLAVGAELAHPRGTFAFSTEQTAQSGIRPSPSIPQWLNDEPVVFVSCWDEFPLFRRRLGGGPVWFPELYAEQGSEESIKKLKEVGVTLAIIHFFKGFGLEAERPHIEKARELSKKLKQHGIRVGLYVGSTICYETFLTETPEAAEWFVPDFLDKPVVYPHQPFRKRVYFMHPGYREYIKKVVRLGIESLHADLIHFDNTSSQATPEIFQHPMAIKDFRAYLGKKYRPSELTDRLGFSDVEYVIPPKLDYLPETIVNPLWQEWTEFRTYQLGEYYAEMASLIHSLNPEVGFDNNPAPGMSGVNTIWSGVSLPQILPHLEAFWTEERNYAGVSDEGVLVSKIRTFKVAAPRNKLVLCYTENRLGETLEMAESLAYNRQSIGMIGGYHNAPDLPAAEKRYVRFFHDNFEFYKGVRSVADVALLYTYATMGFNNGRPQDGFMLASQMLIQNRLLFDIVFDDQLADLSKYPVLFLADQEFLSAAQIEQIRKYVSGGGALVATGQTSLFTERGLRRRNFGLQDCFGVNASMGHGAREAATAAGGSVRRSFGKGKVAYLPEIIPSVKRPSGVSSVTSRYWAPAKNQQELRDAVRWAIGEQPTVETDASISPFVTINLVYQQEKDRLILHVLNYDHARTASTGEIPVEVAIPSGKKVKTVRMLTPDGSGGAREIESSGQQRARFSLPPVEVYSIALLELE